MTIAMYLRLSKEDEFIREESNSISMQRLLLQDYVREHFPEAKVSEFSDDGYSGTNFDRPGVQALLESVKNGEIDCIIVKDFSRFARDYIELGAYLEQIFPFMGVRFISVNDKYDSARSGESTADLDVNFKNLLNDLYSKDLSVKVRASLRSIKEQGNFVGSEAPFGYVKDPSDRHQIIIASEEAGIVRRIFEMYAGGMSTVKIASVLNEEGVKTPAQIWMEKGIRKSVPKGGRFVWQHSGILRMLKNRAYAGDLVQGVTECRKIRKDRHLTDPSRWIVTENQHEPIVDRETFNKVQERLGRKRGPWKKRDTHVLAGRLTCGCCGRTLRHSYQRGHPYYWCSGLNVYHLDGCVKRVEDFYLEEVIMFQLQQHIGELGESDRLTLEAKAKAEKKKERLEKQCEAAKREIESARKKRLADFEAYALGKTGSYGGAESAAEVDRLQQRYEELLEQLAMAKDEARKYGKMKVHEEFAVTHLTPELMDRYIESVVVESEEEIRIRWKEAE